MGSVKLSWRAAAQARRLALGAPSSRLPRMFSQMAPQQHRDTWHCRLTQEMAVSPPPAAAALEPAHWSRTRSLPDGLGDLILAASCPLTSERPGNGGLRLWQYSSPEAAMNEAKRLGEGMEVKHSTYRTGFSGAKLVCASSSTPSEWSARQKAVLISEAGKMLHELAGKMYTGCDLNTTTDDMNSLHEQAPYVLAAIPNPNCCPNTATAFGVFGAVEATMGGEVHGKTFLVHGCGNVGSVVARLLVAHGAARVLTHDLVAARASIEGCVNISADPSWWTREVTAVVPCSASGLLTVGRPLSARTVVGASNLPFGCAEAQARAEAAGLIIPEGVSSAGAVIVDSIEHFARSKFAEAPPSELYEFTRQLVRQKTAQLITLAGRLRVPPSLAVPIVAESDAQQPVGTRFEEWLGARAGARHMAKIAAIASASAASASASPVAEIAQIARIAEDALSSVVPAPAPPVPAPGLARSPPRRPAVDARGGAPGQPRRGVGMAPQAARRGFASSAAPADAPAETADVAIVGAGVMGLNIAYQLKRRDPKLKVAVYEQAAALGYGSSGYSTGFQRAYYSFDETMRFALDGIAAYKDWKDYLQDEAAEAYFTETGALWMLGYAEEQNAAMIDRLARFGVQADLIDQAELGRRFPLVNAEPFPTYDASGEEQPTEHGAASFSAVYEHGCGHLDSSTCLSDLAKACRRDGIALHFNRPAASFERSADGARCAGVRFVDGTRVAAGATVNASGPWFNKLNASVGLDDLTTEALPIRIQVAHKTVPDEFCGLPFVADGWGPSGIYFMPRRANNQLVFGSVAHRFESEVVDPDAYNTALDPDVKQDYLNCLFHRLPSLPRDGEVVGFSSMYTVNQDDVHPMIGETSLGGLWACNGFSGHGFKLAPAVGSLVAQQLTGLKTGAWETSVPLDFMGPYREPLKLKAKTHFA